MTALTARHPRDSIHPSIEHQLAFHRLSPFQQQSVVYMSDLEGAIEDTGQGFERRSLREGSETSDTSQISSLAGSKKRVRGGQAADAEDKGRKKRVYPKVRTGCDTCKRRKIKCDEGKPVCRNCTKSGRTCLGYHPPQAKLFEPSQRTKRLDHATETALFNYFKSTACHRLAAFSQLQLNLTFWQETVPALSLEYPPVRHAILAFAAIFEGVESPKNNESHLNIAEQDPYFALEQYTEVLEKLNSGISSATLSITAALICCLLLTLCDLWHFGMPISFKHVFGGLELCRIIKKTSPSKSPLPEASAVDAGIMIPAYQYFADCATTGLNHKTKEQEDLLRDFATTLPAIIPPTATKVSDLYAVMELMLTHIARLENGVMGVTPTELDQRLSELQSMIDDAIASADDDDDDERLHNLHLLRAHCTAASINLAAVVDGTEQAYDHHYDDFELIIAQIEPLLPPKNGASRYAMIAPLFLTATRCRESDLRHRALDALHGIRQREQYWTSCTAYQIARDLIRLEEEGTFADEEARVDVTGIRFNPAQGYIDLGYNVISPVGVTQKKSTIAWSQDEQSLHPVHKMEAFDLPRRVLQVHGYSVLMLAYSQSGCHCKRELSPSQLRG